MEKLLSEGHSVIGIDNLSTEIDFMSESLDNNSFKFIKSDLKDINNLISKIEDVEIVFHLAANADVRFGLNNPS